MILWVLDYDDLLLEVIFYGTALSCNKSGVHC